MTPVAILFARTDSVYKTLEGCDVFDINRDARNFRGGMPVVAHPPCRGWGRLRSFAQCRPGEHRLALLAVRAVRLNGGVLEHPSASTLWQVGGLPEPGKRDEYGGFTLPIDQHWWGHLAAKKSLLYIVGIEPGDLPAMPLSFDAITHVVQTKQRLGSLGYRPCITKPQREATPRELAIWLCQVARACHLNNGATQHEMRPPRLHHRSEPTPGDFVCV